MRKRQILAELTTISVIGVTSILLIVQVPKPVEVVAEPIQIESKQYYQPTLIQVEVEEVGAPNIEPVSSILYEISLSDDEQLQIRDITDDFEIDFELVLAIIKTESDFNPTMIGDNGNSFGLMQIQPKWWTSYFNQYECSDWLSVSDNVTVGCAILRYLYDSYGSTEKVLNAYNTGNPNRYNGYSQRVLSNLEDIENLKR